MAQPRALLVQPWIADFAAYDFWIHPLGLLFVAGFLAQRGWSLDWLDLLAGARVAPSRADGRGPLAARAFPLPDGLGANRLPRAGRSYRGYGISAGAARDRLATLARPDVILLTSQMTYWYPGVRAAVRQLRRRFPDVPLWLGGGYAALAPRHAAATPGVTGIVAERRLGPALETLSRALRLPPPTAEELERAQPAWGLVGATPHAAWLTSWGCPGRCPYCATPATFGAWQARRHDVLLDELGQLARRQDVRHLAIYDDALLFRAQHHFLPLADAIRGDRQLRSRFRWHLPNAVHPRWIDRRVAAALAALEVDTLWLGAESFDAAWLQATGGKVTPEETAAAVAHLQAAGLPRRRIGAYILGGLPGQEDASVLSALAAEHRLGLRVALASYSPIPGTPSFTSLAASEPRLRQEPLWQNNTLREMESPERWRALRDEVRRLNSALS